MDRTGLTENFESGLFESSDGRRFVRCEFDPDNPVWINVTSARWSTVYAGRKPSLDWSDCALPRAVRLPLQQVVCLRLKRFAPSYMDSVRVTLHRFCAALLDCGLHLRDSFDDLRATDWLAIWERMDAHSCSIFRSLYCELARQGLAGADFALATEMRRWKARNDVEVLRVVTTWNATSGSFTSSEWELIRHALKVCAPSESDIDCATRVFGRILEETLKRPLQILSMRSGALWISPSGREFFLRVPKAKRQAGDRPTSWQITESLAGDIRAYSARLRVHALQEQLDRLVVFPLASGQKSKWEGYGQVDVAIAKAYLQAWAMRQNIISPRTGTAINLTPYRIRHTGATTLALQGAPRDQIQEILEHDSPESADAYIQAVGSDLMPALERSTGRGVGTVFSELSRAYFFKGRITDRVHERPIHIPIAGKGGIRPALVGSCGKSGICTLHPFWACYDGCPHFLAWQDGPHEKSLKYVESELERWSQAEGGKERTKLGKDFDRVGAAIREVMDQAEQSKVTDVHNKRD